MRTLGIDLASKPSATAGCFINWGDEGAVVEVPELGLHDEAILERIAVADATGIDAPFGWPQAEAQAVHRYTMDGVWEDPRLTDLRFRQTEQHVRQTVDRAPLSTTSDWIVWATWRCVGLLSHVAKGGPVNRLGGHGVFEVYPAASLRVWELSMADYKSDPSVRATLIDQLVSKADGRLIFEGDARELLIESDDALDACIASLVTKEAANPDRATWPSRDLPTEKAEQVRREGWIHLPQAPLTDLFSAPHP